MNPGALLSLATVAAGVAVAVSLIGTIISVRRAREQIRRHAITDNVAHLLDRNLADLSDQLDSLSSDERELFLEELVRAISAKERVSTKSKPEGESDSPEAPNWPITPA